MDILFDCDTGHDDAIALMIALAHPKRLNLLGVSCVAGNNTLEKVTRNTLSVLEHLGFDSVPVSMGYAAPLRYAPEPQPEGHGKSGMDGPVLPNPKMQVTGIHAIDFMRQQILAAPGKVTIVALGPLTNVGMLLYTWPGLLDKIESIHLMGGSLWSGNILPKAEFNIYHDPDAARIVFRSGANIVMSGLEVCFSGAMLFSEYEPYKNGGKASRLVWELLEFFSQYSRKRGKDRTPVFDMTTVIQLLSPELFLHERHAVDVETQGDLCRGMTVADLRLPISEGRLNCDVLTEVTDREAFVGVLSESLAILDARCERLK